MKEEWAEIAGFGGYFVSSFGRVKNRHDRILRPNILRTGYETVALRKDKAQKRLLIHRLVALTFVGKQPDGYQAAHEDGNRRNNHLTNLRWKTPKENGQDKIRHGTAARGERHGRAALSLETVVKVRAMAGQMRTANRPWGATTISRELGVSKHAVGHILAGHTWLEAAQ